MGYLGLEPRTYRLKAEYSTIELVTLSFSLLRFFLLYFFALLLFFKEKKRKVIKIFDLQKNIFVHSITNKKKQIQKKKRKNFFLFSSYKFKNKEKKFFIFSFFKFLNKITKIFCFFNIFNLFFLFFNN